MAETYLTKAGLKKLQQEIERLAAQKRKLSVEVGRARELGDLRENAEFHAAKEKLQQVITRLGELQGKLANVCFIDELPAAATGEAVLGMTVTLQDLAGGPAERYTLVGPDEADPAGGRISYQSPLGRGLLGRKAGEQVTIPLPAGPWSIKILSVTPADS